MYHTPIAKNVKAMPSFSLEVESKESQSTVSELFTTLLFVSFFLSYQFVLMY